MICIIIKIIIIIMSIIFGVIIIRVFIIYVHIYGQRACWPYQSKFAIGVSALTHKYTIRTHSHTHTYEYRDICTETGRRKTFSCRSVNHRAFARARTRAHQIPTSHKRNTIFFFFIFSFPTPLYIYILLFVYIILYLCTRTNYTCVCICFAYIFIM